MRLLRGSGLLVGRARDEAMQKHSMKGRTTRGSASRITSAWTRLSWAGSIFISALHCLFFDDTMFILRWTTLYEQNYVYFEKLRLGACFDAYLL
jgi:hypothetical protein